MFYQDFQTESLRDSDASSASRKRPGIIYTSDRNADSICETDPALSDTKFSYILMRFRGDADDGGIRAGVPRACGIDSGIIVFGRKEMYDCMIAVLSRS